MGGAAASGKSSVAKKIQSQHPELEIANPDVFVEDKSSDFYNNLSKSSSHVKNVVIPDLIKNEKSFIWDTTSSNSAKILEFMKDYPWYDYTMVMVYTHPIVSFLRNFDRERKVPKVAIFSTWNKVYQNLEIYKKTFKDNLLIYNSSHEKQHEKYIKSFEEYVENKDLKLYLKDTGLYDQKSTFRKDTDGLSGKELDKVMERRRKTAETLDKELLDTKKWFKAVDFICNNVDLGGEDILKNINLFINGK